MSAVPAPNETRWGVSFLMPRSRTVTKTANTRRHRTRRQIRQADIPVACKEFLAQLRLAWQGSVAVIAGGVPTDVLRAYQIDDEDTGQPAAWCKKVNGQ